MQPCARMPEYNGVRGSEAWPSLFLLCQGEILWADSVLVTC